MMGDYLRAQGPSFINDWHSTVRTNGISFCDKLFLELGSENVNLDTAT